MEIASHRRRRHREAGYTLLEIMLVVGIISILIGSAIYMLVGNIDVARRPVWMRISGDQQLAPTRR